MKYLVVLIALVCLLSSCGHRHAPLNRETTNVTETNPVNTHQTTIAHMTENKWMWAPDYALFVAKNGDCYINRKLHCFNYGKQYKYYSLRVMRIGYKYKIDVSNCDKNILERGRHEMTSGDASTFSSIIEIIKK